MQLHQLKPIHKSKRKRILGKGGVHGHYCCQGVAKGQKARGRKFKPLIKELIKKYPKLRGYKFKSFAERPLVFNLDIFENNFEAGAKVSPQILIEKKLARKIEGVMPKIKILAKGEIKKALNFEGFLFSKDAKEKIEKAGGKIN